MGPAEYGEVTLFNSWAIVIGVFATLSIYAGVFNTAMLEFEGKVQQFMSSMLGLTTVCTLVTFSALVLAISIFGNFTGIRPTLMVFMAVNFIFNTTYLYWQSAERFAFKYKAVAAISIPSSIFGVLGAIALMRLPELAAYKVEVRAIVPALPIFLVGAYLYFATIKNGKAAVSKANWGYALALSLPLIPHYLSQAFLQQFDKFVIEAVVGRSDVGLYGLALALASGLTLFWTAINTTWNPWALRHIQAGNLIAIRQSTVILLRIVALLACVGSCVAPEVISILAPKEYFAASKFVPFLLASSYFQFSQSMLLLLQFQKKNISEIAIGSVLASVLSVALNVLLLPKFGAVVSSIIVAGVQCFLLIYHHIQTKKFGLEMIPLRELLVTSTTLVVATTAVFAVGDGLLVARYATALLALALVVKMGLDAMRSKV